MRATAAPPPTRDALVFLGIALLGVALRVALLFGAFGIRPIRDEMVYLNVAFDWMEFGVYHGGPAPGYPWFLSIVMRVFGGAALDAAKWIQVVILSPVIGLSVMAIGRRLFGRRAAVAAGLCWALYLPLSAYTHVYWSETLFLALLTPAQLLLIKATAGNSEHEPWSLLGAGLLLGAAALVKEGAAYLPLLLAVALVVRGRPADGALLLLACAVVIAPWTMRNRETYDRFALVGLTAGVNSLLGLNGTYSNFDYTRRLFATYPEGHWVYRAFMAPRPDAWEESRLPNSVDRSRDNVRRGIFYMANRPAYFLVTRVKKVADLVNPTSFLMRHSYRGLYDGWLAHGAARRAVSILAPTSVAALLLLGVAGLIHVPRAALIAWVPLLVVSYFSATSLLVSMSRFRDSDASRADGAGRCGAGEPFGRPSS